MLNFWIVYFISDEFTIFFFVFWKEIINVHIFLNFTFDLATITYYSLLMMPLGIKFHQCFWNRYAIQITQTFGHREGPTVSGIRKFSAKVCETSFIVDALRRECARTLPTPEIIEAAAESALDAPTYNRSQEWNNSRTSLRWIFGKKNVGITSFKAPLGQELKPWNHPFRFRFARWANKKLYFFAVDAHFYIGGYIKK